MVNTLLLTRVARYSLAATLIPTVSGAPFKILNSTLSQGQTIFILLSTIIREQLSEGNK